MWLQRIMFNVKARLLNQTRDPIATAPSASTCETTRLQVIQKRLLDLDQRLARLQSR